jgi:hypothetical protein
MSLLSYGAQVSFAEWLLASAEWRNCCLSSFGGGGWLIVISAVCGILTTRGLMAREVMLPQIFSGQRFEKVASYTQIADQL